MRVFDELGRELEPIALIPGCGLILLPILLIFIFFYLIYKVIALAVEFIKEGFNEKNLFKYAFGVAATTIMSIIFLWFLISVMVGFLFIFVHVG